MAVDDDSVEIIFLSSDIFYTLCFFIVISLIIHVYESLNIDIVFPVTNGFQQDTVFSIKCNKVKYDCKSLKCMNSGILIFMLFWNELRCVTFNFKRTGVPGNFP